MDVTNPGLVNVADQSVGRPDTSVPALSVPRDDDSVVAVADSAQPAAPLATVRVFPTPVAHDAGDAQFPATSQSFGVVPGTAPTYAPSPPASNPVSPDDQYVPQAGTSEYTVAGPRTSIQTNQNPESGRDYVVASVLDADTGGPVTEPATSVAGTFSGVFDETTELRFASPTAFPASLVDGVTVGITCPGQPSYQGAGPASGVVSQAGATTSVADAGGGSVTVSVADPISAGVVAGQIAVISGASVSSYNVAREISNVNNYAGTFTDVKDSGTGSIVFVSPTPLPAGFAVSKIFSASGAYSGPRVAASLTNYAGTYDSVADVGLGVVTFHSPVALPVGTSNGQFVTLSGAVYSGLVQISNVTADAFDASPAGGFLGTSTGAFVSYTITTPEPFYDGTDAGTWTCQTFDIAVAYAGDSDGNWAVANFDLPGTYVATATGTWSYYPTNQLGTTRYRLGLSPADLANFGVVVQDREIVFADPTLTAANSGASRLVEFATESWIVVGKYDEDSDVPVLTTPQAGDTLTLFVQREGSELFVEHLGQVVTTSPLLAAPVVVAPPAPPSFASQGSVNSSTGSQPGQPVVGGGTQVPTAVTVEVASQSTTVGLPANVFI